MTELQEHYALVQSSLDKRWPTQARETVAAAIVETVERNEAVMLLPLMPHRALDTGRDGWGETPAMYLVHPDAKVQIRIDGPAIVWAQVSNDPEWLGWEPVYRPIDSSCAYRVPDGYNFIRFRAERKPPRRISPQERFRRGLYEFHEYAPESLIEPRVRIGVVAR